MDVNVTDAIAIIGAAAWIPQIVIGVYNTVTKFLIRSPAPYKLRPNKYQFMLSQGNPQKWLISLFRDEVRGR
jgi:hypothetical protein